MNFFTDRAGDSVTVTFAYAEAGLDKKLLAHARAVITLLAKATVGVTKGARSDEKHIDAALQSLVGFCALAVGEAQALLALVTAGLERQARVHLRALNEYQTRANLLLGDPEKAFSFKIAAAAELDRFANMLPGKVDAQTLANARLRFLSDVDAEAVQKEKEVIGDMRAVMERADPGSYATNFAYLSLISHGSVLALDELSNALNQDYRDITQQIGRDGNGINYVLSMCTAVIGLCLHLEREFKVDTAEESGRLIFETQRLREQSEGQA